MTTQKRQLSEFAAPGMDGEEHGIQQHPETTGVQDGGIDREGAMAKADLYKLASYAHKLYQQIQDDTQLEAWVQAKITKAADYIASVYHYLEYEMKFSEYGHHLDNSDTLSESQKNVLKARLNEAKEKVKALKVAQAEKIAIEEGVLSGGETPCAECGGTGVVHQPAAVIPDHVKGKVAAYNRQAKAMHAASKRLDKNHNGIPDEEEVDESYGWDETPKEKKERESREKAEANKPKTSSTGGTITKTKTGLVHTAKRPEEKVEESGDYGWDETPKEKREREAKEKADADKPRTSSTGGTITKTKTGLRHTAKGHDEKVDESKPSAGLTKKEKSATVKKAKAGGDIGKPGKGFKKVAAKAAKEYGSKEKGEKVAAAAMWKNVKETTAYVMEKEAATKKDAKFAALAEPKDKITYADKIAGAKKNEKKTVKESAEFTRMQEQLGRLNRNETHQLVESSEADQIRALSKRLLG